MQLSTLARSGPIRDITRWPTLAPANTSPQRLFRRVDSGPAGPTEHEASQRLVRDACARPSRPVLITFAFAVLFGLSVPVTPAAGLLHLHPLPLTYLPWPAAIVTAYCACVRWVKPN
jgi:hypothetical protein